MTPYSQIKFLGKIDLSMVFIINTKNEKDGKIDRRAFISFG
jgi:hypothetical protein